MNAAIGIASRQGPSENQLLKRCVDSITGIDAGMPYELRVESGELFTRGEKRQRIFNWAHQKNIQYVCILEDDTVILQPNWLAMMVMPIVAEPTVGMVNPLETKDGTFPGGPPELHGKVIETSKLYGFCILYNMEWGPIYDPLVTHLDDLGMSLLCRSKGYRLAISGQVTVQHTKQPFLPDDVAPWDQADRERWGEDSVYYQKDKHFEARLIESKYLINRFGDMATKSLPPELVKELWNREGQRLAETVQNVANVINLKEPG